MFGSVQFSCKLHIVIVVHVHRWWKKIKHQQQQTDDEVQRERKSSITRIWCRLWAQAYFYFQSNPVHHWKMIPRSLVNFFLLINEPYYNRVVFFSLSFKLWFDSDFFFSIHCNRVFNNLQNDLNRSFFFSFSISSLKNAAIFPQICSVHVV